MEDELVAAVGSHAQPGKTLFNYFYVAMLCCAHLTEQCALLNISVADESGGAEFFLRGKGCRGRGLGLGLGLGLGVVLPLGPAVSEALVSINCKKTCDVWPAARLDT